MGDLGTRLAADWLEKHMAAANPSNRLVYKPLSAIRILESKVLVSICLSLKKLEEEISEFRVYQ